MSYSNVIVAFLKQCSSSLRHIHQLHAFLIPRGLQSDNLILSRLIEACSSLGHSLYAIAIFSYAKRPNTYLFNTMINVLSPSQAVPMYNNILVSGLRPDSYTVPFVLKAIVDLSALEAGLQIHCHAVSTGLCLDVNVATALVRMYSFFGRVLDARNMFDEMTKRDFALWNAMIAGYAKASDVDSAWKLFEEMPERNSISWTCVISGFAQVKRPREAVVVFKRMLSENIKPDEVMILALVSACAHLGSLELGKRIHGYVLTRGFYRKLPLRNALIDMYLKSGSIRMARNVFEGIEERSVVTYTTMIAGLALHGLGCDAAAMFSRMESAFIKPNEVTFIAMLSACSHAGLVDMGRWYFNNMASRYKIQPKIEHYGCLIDLLGRSGYLEEAKELIRTMPFKANEAIWGCLLAASNIHSDVELGKLALQHLMVLEPHNSGNYTLLSNIHAALGSKDESGMLRKVMRDKGVKKIPGWSFIEVNNRVHQFVAGDTSHSEFHATFGMVLKIFNQLKMAVNLHMDSTDVLEFQE